MSLLKMKRLVDGDTLFAWRVEAACWSVGVPFTPEVLRAVAADPTVLGEAVLDEPDTIDSSGVADASIIAVVEALPAPEPEEPE